MKGNHGALMLYIVIVINFITITTAIINNAPILITIPNLLLIPYALTVDWGAQWNVRYGIFGTSKSFFHELLWYTGPDNSNRPSWEIKS